MLKKSGAVFGLISAAQDGKRLMDYVCKNIRGGMAVAFQPHFKANNPECPDYDENAERTHIAAEDFRNLYGSCMCRPLPVGQFKSHKLNKDPVQQLKRLMCDYNDDSSRGFFVVCDWHIPKEKHAGIDFAPPQSTDVPLEVLSTWQQEQFKTLFPGCKKHPGKKLIPSRLPRVEERNHISYLKFLVTSPIYGAQITKVHAIWSFKQTRCLREWVEDCAANRAGATVEDIKQLWKLLVNANYGRFLFNISNRKNPVVHLDAASFLKRAAKRHVDWHVVEDNEADDSFLGVTSSWRTDTVTYKTPRIVGFAILEYAKEAILRRWTEVHKATLGDRCAPLYTDTDSIIFVIRGEESILDYYRARNAEAAADYGAWSHEKAHMFTDLSKLDKADKTYAGNIGSPAYDLADYIGRFLGAGTKMYAMTVCRGGKQLSGPGITHAKGVPAFAKLTTKDFEKAIENPKQKNRPVAQYQICYKDFKFTMACY
jgi:hypothetical protein